MSLRRVSKQGPWALVCLMVMLALSAWAAPVFPSLTGRVVDNAGMLDGAAEARLVEMSAALEQKTSVQFVVVTVPELQGYDIADFGYQLGRAWGIGQKGKNNGLLLVVAPNERKVRIEVGYGLEGIVTDARASGVIQGIILPQFKAGDMQGGIVAGSTALVQLVGGDAEAVDAAVQAQPKGEEIGFGGILMVLMIIGYFLLAMRYPRLFILLQILGSMSGGGGRGGGGFRGGGGGFGGGGASGGW